ERRTRAVATRRSLAVESVSDLGRLDPAAILRVREEAQPHVRSADELHDVLLSRIVVAADEGGELWQPFFEQLTQSRRATTILRENAAPMWTAAERLPAVFAAFPEAVVEPPLDVPEGVRRDWTAEEARVAMVRGLLEVCGPATHSAVAGQL